MFLLIIISIALLMVTGLWMNYSENDKVSLAGQILAICCFSIFLFGPIIATWIALVVSVNS